MSKVKSICARIVKKLARKLPTEDWIITARREYANNVLTKKEKNGNMKELTPEQALQIQSFWRKYNKNAYRLFNPKQYAIYNKYRNKDTEITKYIPDDFYYCYADLYFTNYHLSVNLDNKNLYDLYFSDIERPRCIARNMCGTLQNEAYESISLEQVISLCQKEGNVIIKKTVNSDGGHGITFFENCTEQEQNLKYYLKNNHDFIIQSIIKQHQVLNEFNPNSVNTIRIMTLFFESKVIVLSAVFRIGINGAKVDNASSGGIVCGINNDGSLKNRAFDASANVYEKHPQGKEFDGVIIPSYADCICIAQKLANRFVNYSKLISWDFAIDENGHPVLIEANLTGGQLDFHQLCNGPIWGEWTDSILKKIFKESTDVKIAL